MRRGVSRSVPPSKRTDAERQLLEGYEGAMLNLCRQALERSGQLAENLLKQGMGKEGNWTKVAFDPDRQRSMAVPTRRGHQL